MRRYYSAFMAAVFSLGLVWHGAYADGIIHRSADKPACEPGYQIVAEVVYQDVVKYVCKMVPETKTKWVYSVVDDPICIKDSKHGDCPNCTLVHRKVLVKKQIQEPCGTTKCVREKIVEKVAVTIYRKVPIAAGVPNSAAPSANVKQ